MSTAKEEKRRNLGVGGLAAAWCERLTRVEFTALTEQFLILVSRGVITRWNH